MYLKSDHYGIILQKKQITEVTSATGAIIQSTEI